MKVGEILNDYRDDQYYSPDLKLLKSLWGKDVIAYKSESFLNVFLVKTARTYKSFIALFEKAHERIPLTVSYTKLISSFRLEDFFNMVKDLTIINEREYDKALKSTMLKNL